MRPHYPPPLPRQSTVEVAPGVPPATIGGRVGLQLVTTGARRVTSADFVHGNPQRPD